MATSPLEPGTPHRRPEENSRHGRLSFRPLAPVEVGTEVGLVRLESIEGAPLGLAHVPERTDSEPVRLVLLLHGAGGSARQGLELMLGVAGEHRLLLLAPKSQGSTWDVIVNGYGPDVRRIDRLLEDVASRYPVDGIAVAGFSDGASYALSLGIGNGDVFDAVVAFSPGFAVPLVEHGKPRIFISHGDQDPVLPVDRCSRRLAPRLTRDGYRVTYQEFEGGHNVPEIVVRSAANWLADT